MESKINTVTFEGVVTSRPDEPRIARNGSDDNVDQAARLVFRITGDPYDDVNRDGEVYTVKNPEYPFQVMNFDDEQHQRVFTVVSDLDIGDRIRVTAQFLTRRSRAGFPQWTARVHDVQVLGGKSAKPEGFEPTSQ